MIKVNKESYAGLIRQELDETYLCIPAEVGKPLFFNKTFYEIFSLCNENTINKIVSEMSERYPDIPSYKIKEGVENTIWYLFNIGIINLEENERDVDVIMDELKARLVAPDEKDFSVISKYIISKYDECLQGCFLYASANVQRDRRAIIKEIYRTVQIRLEYASGKQMFYKYVKPGTSKLSGVAGIVLHSSKRVSYINTLVADDFVEAHIMINLLLDILRKRRVFNLKCLLSEREIDFEYIKFFEEIGFKKEAQLINEHIYGDLLVYSYNLKE